MTGIAWICFLPSIKLCILCGGSLAWDTMTIRFVQFLPEALEGLAFPLRDLHLALAWAASRPAVHLQIRLDQVGVTEVLEVSPRRAQTPRWRIWRTYEGKLQVDDLAEAAFGLPYLTVATALEFITTQL
jgi:hypothetical protein